MSDSPSGPQDDHSTYHDLSLVFDCRERYIACTEAESLIIFRYLFYYSGIYTVGGEAEGYIVSKIVSPFDSHPFLWIALLAAVLILSFIVLTLMFKSQHRKGSEIFMQC